MNAGLVEVLDFDLRLVGNDAPGSIVIRRVSLVYGVEQRFHVIAPIRIERFLLSKEALCTVYPRVSSLDATPISEAVVELNSNHATQTDAYGRALVGVAVGKPQNLRIEAKGYQPERLPITCREQGEIQKTITLKSLSDRHQ
jgi:hypothetical protein